MKVTPTASCDLLACFALADDTYLLYTVPISISTGLLSDTVKNPVDFGPHLRATGSETREAAHTTRISAPWNRQWR